MNEHYFGAPEKISCCEVLNFALNFPSSSKGWKREVGVRPIVVG